MKTMTFKSYDEFDAWTEQFDGCHEWEEVPVLISNEKRVSADLATDCKSWKTALRRFSKAFPNVPEFDGWFDGMKECAENGYFSDVCEGEYSWGIEEPSDGNWYVYLNVYK